MLAIIPARGGSKGLPGKNIKDLNGKPMIAYTVEAAKGSRYIDEIVVSTDCDQIYREAVRSGAKETFLRPARLATDEALAVDAYIYTIDRLQAEQGLIYEDVVILQPTSPLRTSSDIDACIELYRKKDADSVISFCKQEHPIEWSCLVGGDGSVSQLFSDGEKLKNRQEQRQTCYPNGAVYVFRVSLLRAKKYYSERTYAHLMPRMKSVDVDTLDDFTYAEFLMRERCFG